MLQANDDELLAVVVMVGADGRSGAELAARAGLVVVRLESRHGALGFLATQDRLVTGNLGLLDQVTIVVNFTTNNPCTMEKMLKLQYAMQVLGLKWVSANIDLLGGDPNRVTVLGSGKAASTAALHLLSPLSCNLFTRIILQVSEVF